MNDVTYYLISLASQSPAGSFGLNTNNLVTTLINIGVVLCLLIIFGKGFLRNFLDTRKNKIVNTMQISDELYSSAVEKLEKAQARLCKVENEAKQLRVTGYSEIEHEKLNLINSTYKTLERLEKKKKETCSFEQQQAFNDVRQWVLQQTLQRVLKTLNGSFNPELHLRTIRINISMLGTLK
uniref:ATP synthase subunit b, chloroplastic n=1 Tax=Cuscuta obtusiflora TaxID=437280 RepID=ATPF_CUSOB|nr:ATP synthase CF0 B subunit [Cuscuta obtusiflora]A8W3H6.1 RecName: Full=ATP synthase subunit b, chloroplastic; AltName: Full=ATP synthase F(0) sector subunit b; AltName: Full=ATPase subunit I [Cuscuta obtusiflora]ABW20551.1 ATP synthase CF0 subunit I [Cuscuta obtusiflora]